MSVNIRTVAVAVFLGMMATLGHGAWHRELTSILGTVVYLFTGAHTSG